MKKSDFYFDLPPELIAQHPLPQRDSSRLLVLNRQNGAIAHRHFYDLPEYLQPGDCLVLNDSRVIPARLLGVAEKTGHPVEVVLLTDRGGGVWECLTRPGKRARVGAELNFGNGLLRGRVESVEENGGNRLIRFFYQGVFLELLDQLGVMPLPPYIKEKLEDPERYQTVYSRHPGSAAAPTAGLHFTQQLLDTIRQKGVDVETITLHGGVGTFRPVKEEEIEEHQMHAEFYTIGEQTAQAVNRCRERGGKVVAVGTTACRTLETVGDEQGRLRAQSGWTDIFIYPGYRFHVVDKLVTNFHLPESTLMMLISALAGREQILKAYQTAIEQRYRFFSFGDAMLIE